MPELPEVETIKRDLNKYLKNKTIAAVKINPKRFFISRGVKKAKFLNLPVLEFQKKLKSQKIKNIKRRAKIFIFELVKAHQSKNQNQSLLVHLKLTGQLIYSQTNGELIKGGHNIKNGKKNLPNNYTQAVFIFTDASRLFYNDLRQFGWFKLIDQTELDKELSKLGPEPLGIQFKLNTFQEIFKNSLNKKIKSVLMDQEKIAGIGNIYADEVCFYAKVLPQKLIKNLTDFVGQKLFLGIKIILKKAIEKRGSSIDSYLDARGKPGGYVPFLKVYGRQGQKCHICQTPIKKIKLNGRGTHFCPECQK